MQQFYRSILSVLIISQMNTHVLSQNRTNLGKEYWLGFSTSMLDTGSNVQKGVLYIGGSSQNAIVTVSIDSSGVIPATWYKKVYNIPANSFVTAEPIPSGPKGSNPNFDARFGGEDTFRQKGIHIQSDVPIAAFFHQYGSAAADKTMLIPTNNWGYAYSSVNSQQIDAAGPAYSFVYIIAKENNTKVEIIPSVPTRKQKQAGVPFIVGLQKGQIYQILSQTDNAGNGGQFTGTIIKSIIGSDSIVHPIAAFAGSTRTRGESVPCGSGSGRDNDIQQLFPLQSLGLKYLTAPLSTGSGSPANPTFNASQFQTSVFKIINPHAGTQVKRNGTILTNLINGQYYQFSSNTADFIEADQPILVGQFMSGSSTCNPGIFGDPDMVVLSPLEQSVKQASFVRTTAEAININYVTLIVPTAGLPSLKIDNSSTYDYSYAHPQKPDYTIVIKGWVATKTTTAIKCDSPFVSVIYGLGVAESYACSIGGSDSIGPAFHRPISLPLKLVSFNATADENSNKLKWRTANEVNLHRFEVERSNNSKDFILIGKVAAGKNEYQYVDVHPSSSINYYRLKIIDNDGSFHFSPIVSVFNNATFSVSVFPIPAKNNLNISIQSENKQEASISIISIDGKTVLTKRVTLIEGLSNSSINIQTLPNGRYFLRAELGNKKQTTIAFEKL